MQRQWTQGAIAPPRALVSSPVVSGDRPDTSLATGYPPCASSLKRPAVIYRAPVEGLRHVWPEWDRDLPAHPAGQTRPRYRLSPDLHARLGRVRVGVG